jgi:hypothetical protein
MVMLQKCEIEVIVGTCCELNQLSLALCSVDEGEKAVCAVLCNCAENMCIVPG